MGTCDGQRTEQGVVVETAGGMDRHAPRLLDDDELAFFVPMQDPDRRGGHGRLVAVDDVGDDVAVAEHRVNSAALLVDLDDACARVRRVGLGLNRFVIPASMDFLWCWMSARTRPRCDGRT